MSVNLTSVTSVDCFLAYVDGMIATMTENAIKKHESREFEADFSIDGSEFYKEARSAIQGTKRALRTISVGIMQYKYQIEFTDPTRVVIKYVDRN